MDPPEAPPLSTHVVVRLTMNGNAVDPGTLLVTRVHDRIEALADECRGKHSIAAGARVDLAFERKGALEAKVVGVTVIGSSSLSEEAKACVRDGILAEHPNAEAGTFDGAIVQFE
jgi:hypothetical protein